MACTHSTVRPEHMRQREDNVGNTPGACRAIARIGQRSPPMCIKQVVAWFLLLVVLGCVRSDVAPGVSPAGIRSIELGMSKDEVVGILGPPLSVSAWLGVHKGDCVGLGRPTDRGVTSTTQITMFLDSIFSATPCCEALRHQQEEGRYTLVYSRMVDENGVSPMLWVHFDGLGQVREVFAKLNSRVPFRDDKGIYMRNARGTYLMDEDLLHEYFTQ